MKTNIHIQEFTFDDVLLVPGKSKFELAEENTIEISSYLTNKIRIKNPVVSANMATVTETDMAITMADLGGVGIIHQFMDYERQLKEVKKAKSRSEIVGAAVFSYGNKILEHSLNLKRSGCDVLVVDSANAHNKQAMDLIYQIKKRVKIPLIAGNVATAEAVKDLVKIGVDGVKVGIGPGSHCTTRLVTGFGRPQLSTIKDCVSVGKKYGIPIMADGGIRTPGDAVKAIAFGASTVMIGGMFAGTKQSPGDLIKKNGALYKMSWGNCTNEAYKWTFSKENIKSQIKKIIKTYLYSQREDLSSSFLEEGVSGLIEYKGDVEKIFLEIAGGIRRGLWYGGAKDIKEFQKKIKYVLITNSTLQENKARIANDF